MVIEIETHDITTLAKALNNAVIGYHDVITALYLGCDPSAPHLRPLENIPYEELQKRLETLTDLYYQIEDKEKELTTQWKELWKNDKRRENHEENA